MVSSVSPETEHTPAKVMTVSRESPATPVSDSSLLWRASEGPKSQAAVPVGGGRASPGFETTHQTTHQQPNATGAEGAGGTAGRKRPWLRCLWAAAGPRRASRRRAERSSRRGRLAGGPPPTGGPRSPAQQAPGTPAAPPQHGNRHHTNAPRHTKNRHPLSGCRSVVELGGFEPPTFSLRTRRATNCAIAPRTRTA